MPAEQLALGAGRTIGSALKDKQQHGATRFDAAASKLRSLFEGILEELKRVDIMNARMNEPPPEKLASMLPDNFDQAAMEAGVPLKVSAPALAALFANRVYGTRNAFSPGGGRDFDILKALGRESSSRGVPLGLVGRRAVGRMGSLGYIEPKTVSGSLVDDVIGRIPEGTIDVGSLSGSNPSLIGRESLIPTRSAILTMGNPSDTAREVSSIGKNRMLSSAPSRVLRGAGLTVGMLGAALNNDREIAEKAALLGTGLSLPALLGELQKSHGANTLMRSVGADSKGLSRLLRYRRALPMALFSAAPGLAYLYKRNKGMYDTRPFWK